MMWQWIKTVVAVLLVTALLTVTQTAEAFNRKQSRMLTDMQSSFAAMMRWGEFESAWQLVEPEYRESHPLSGLELDSYRQVQISGYQDMRSSTIDEITMGRNIEIRIINVHTQAERVIRHQEQWRWDAKAKRWWLINGLPNLWAER